MEIGRHTSAISAGALAVALSVGVPLLAAEPAQAADCTGSGILSGVTNGLCSVVHGVTGTLDAATGGATSGLSGVVDTAVGGVTGTVNGTVNGVTGTLSTTVGGVADTVGGLGGGGGLGDTVGGLTNTLGGTVGGVTNTLGDTVGGVTDTLNGTVKGLGDALGAQSGTGGTGASAGSGSSGGGVGGAVGGVVGGAVGAVDDVVRGAADLTGGLTQTETEKDGCLPGAPGGACGDTGGGTAKPSGEDAADKTKAGMVRGEAGNDILPTEPIRPPESRPNLIDEGRTIRPVDLSVDPDDVGIPLLWPGQYVPGLSTHMKGAAIPARRSQNGMETALTAALLLSAVLATRVVSARRARANVPESMPLEGIRLSGSPGRHRMA
ncbi:hypothetical protein ACQP1V_15210 [Microtetraspora malaysiensis]|uniref:hypothetical protein n=1 Tax=Microtetraspora malaysiensis TaxID=161358 RepID=UPI003D93335C